MTQTQRPTDKKNTYYWETLPCGLSIAKYLDVSTCHITARDNELLNNDCDVSSSAAVVFRKKDGYFVHVSHDETEESDQKLLEAGYSQELIRIIQIARAEGASWVCFDSDGAATDFLPTFDW